MSAFLFTWNPKKWPWGQLEADRRKIERKGHARRYWRIHANRMAKKGDVGFLMRLGKHPKGIMGVGVIRRDPEYRVDPDRGGRKIWLVDVEWEVLLNAESEPILSLDSLREQVDAGFRWTPQNSGNSIQGETFERLTRVWQKFLVGEVVDVSDQGKDAVAVSEGRWLERVHYIRERNARLVSRKKGIVLKKTGKLACEVCRFDFLRTYGEIGRNFAECHHRLPLSQIGPGSLTRLDDLAIVCANCHRMLHAGKQVRSIEELAAMVKCRKRSGHKSARPYHG